MLVHKRSKPSADVELDLVCRAIADPTRRAILDLLARAPRTTGALSESFPTTRFAIMKHLNVLQKAGLVIVNRRGRERWNHINAVPLERLHERWVAPLAQRGARSLLTLAKQLEKE